MPLTENQQKLYNLHLQSYKRHQNKPYRIRENFDNFEKEKPEEYSWLQKLDQLFTSHPQLNVKLFFEAPYRLYDDEDYYSLNFYISHAAIKTYTTYLKQLEDQSPDNSFQLEFIKDSLEFIKNYCLEQKINLVQYLEKIEQVTYMWAVHIAEHKISPYAIIGFRYFNIPIYDKIFDMPADERDMLISDLANNYRIYENRLENTKTAKIFVIRGISIISQIINNKLANPTLCDTIN
jgi:hypothetical protein